MYRIHGSFKLRLRVHKEWVGEQCSGRSAAVLLRRAAPAPRRGRSKLQRRAASCRTEQRPHHGGSGTHRPARARRPAGGRRGTQRTPDVRRRSGEPSRGDLSGPRDLGKAPEIFWNNTLVWITTINRDPCIFKIPYSLQITP